MSVHLHTLSLDFYSNESICKEFKVQCLSVMIFSSSFVLLFIPLFYVIRINEHTNSNISSTELWKYVYRSSLYNVNHHVVNLEYPQGS